jgi:uncharacterized membrane protein
MMTVDNLLFALILVAALGCGLMAGLFFAFSVSVMPALGRLPAAQGIAAMQTINAVILNPLFLTTFLGTAAACLGVIIFSLLRWSNLGAAYLLAGGALYLAGSLLVTMLFNVPRNEALAAAPAAPDSARLWANYLATWTAWNHVRTVASLAAAALLTLALSY